MITGILSVFVGWTVMSIVGTLLLGGIVRAIGVKE